MPWEGHVGSTVKSGPGKDEGGRPCLCHRWAGTALDG